jgi:hypothetical protein
MSLYRISHNSLLLAKNVIDIKRLSRIINYIPVNKQSKKKSLAYYAIYVLKKLLILDDNKDAAFEENSGC